MKSLLRFGAAPLCLALVLLGNAAAEEERGKKNYRLFCMGCHQADGTGSPENGIPSMRDKVGNFLRVPDGRAYLSQVPGSLNTPLSDAETAEVLNWMVLNIGRDSTPGDFRPYSADDVRQFRASVPSDIPGMRVELIKRIDRLTVGSKD